MAVSMATLALGFLIMVGVAVVFIVGILVGRFGSTKPKGPTMTKQVVDASPMEFGAPPIMRWIKYHPTSGWDCSPTKTPVDGGYVWVMEKSGFFGMRKDFHPWKLNELLMVGEGKKAWGIYKPQFVSAQFKIRMDRLDYESRLKTKRIAELTRENAILSRGQKQQVREEVDERVKSARELTPMAMPGRKVGGAR